MCSILHGLTGLLKAVDEEQNTPLLMHDVTTIRPFSSVNALTRDSAYVPELEIWDTILVITCSGARYSELPAQLLTLLTRIRKFQVQRSGVESNIHFSHLSSFSEHEVWFCVYTEHQAELNTFFYSSFGLLDRKWIMNGYEPVSCYMTVI
jgi:hypothetical protein